MAEQSLFCKTTILNLLKKKEPLFGGWRITEFLGAGAFGCVYRMEREDLGRKFVAAMKVISLTRTLDRQYKTMDTLEESLSEDAREIVHLYNLGAHQNVVSWHNHQVFYKRDQTSITALVAVMMDFLPNNLAEELKRGPVEWRKAVKWMIDCLTGLEYIHNHQIIHRDIKPGNIFIDEKGMAKIGDFGVATKLTEKNQAETRVGTPLYIAPEVMKNPLGEGYNHRVDIYSLGMVAYEVLNGALPFEEDCQGNKVCMVKKRLSGDPIRFVRAVPEGVARAVVHALSFDPAKRYAGAAELKAAFEKTLETNGQETLYPKAALGLLPEPEVDDIPVVELHSEAQSPTKADHDDDDVSAAEVGVSTKRLKPAQSASPIPPHLLFPPEEKKKTGFGGFAEKNIFSWEFIFLFALAGGWFRWFTRKDDIVSFIVFIVVNIAAPVFYIFSRRINVFGVPAVFFISLALYAFLNDGTWINILGPLNLLCLGLYIVCAGIATFLDSAASGHKKKKRR